MNLGDLMLAEQETTEILRQLRLLCKHSGLRFTEVDGRRGLEEEARHAEIVKQIQGEIEEHTEGATDVLAEGAEDVLREGAEDGAESLASSV